MSDKKLSDDQILEMIENFYKLSDETREGQLRLGIGKDKAVYQIPNSDYVLKEQLGNYRNNDLVEDYIASKQLGKHVPVETPILVSRPDKPIVSIQKKLKTQGVLDQLKSAHESFQKDLQDKSISPLSADMHLDNYGIDENGKAKILDTNKWDYQGNIVRNSKGALEDLSDGPNSALDKARKTAVERIGNTKSAKARIFRALPFIGPALGAAAAFSSHDASAAVPFLNEAENVGESAGDEIQALREHDARVNYDHSPAKADRNQALRQQALQGLLKK